MIIERTPNEIIIRLPLNTKIDDLQAIVNYARYCELTSLFSFKQEEVDDIAKKLIVIGGLKTVIVLLNENSY